MEKLKVMVVDHSVINRVRMTEIINTTEFGIVEKSASSIPIALEWLGQCFFDVLLLGVETFKEVGVASLKGIFTNYPRIDVLVVSDTKTGNIELTLEAIKLGAIDFILRPENPGTDESKFKTDLETVFNQIRMKKVLPLKKDALQVPIKVNHPKEKINFDHIDLVLIASSTGGPAALELLCQKLPMDFNKPILAVQHMPPEFTHVLATSIDKRCHLSVSEANNGDLIKPSAMYIAQGGLHMVVEEGFGKTSVIKLLDTPYHNGLKPAADILFESVSKIYKGRNILVVVLTGMGNDGLRGVQLLKDACNCYCITQSEASCVVYGMPKCIMEAGLSDEVCSIENIAYRINQLATKKAVNHG